MSELARWCPSLRVVRCHSSDPTERERLRAGPLSDPTSFDVAVTTYDMIKSDTWSFALRRSMWRCLVLDEGHIAKNDGTQIAAALRVLRRRCCVLLSGTLLQNNMRELYNLLNLVYPDIFEKSDPFEACFNITGAVHSMDAAALARAHAMLGVLCLRREKKDVDLGVPPKLETRVMCPLSAGQTAIYRAILMRHSHILDALAPDAAGSSAAPPAKKMDLKKLQNLCMQLRRVCGHPSLLDTEDDTDVPAEAFIAASGKLKVLDRLLSKLKAGGHRVVIFSQFTSMLDIIEAYVQERECVARAIFCLC
jgi:SWI/SNF-related matrix-associated actin-dependent regulator of chromatin subfamily A member 5